MFGNQRKCLKGNLFVWLICFPLKSFLLKTEAHMTATVCDPSELWRISLGRLPFPPSPSPLPSCNLTTLVSLRTESLSVFASHLCSLCSVFVRFISGTVYSEFYSFNKRMPALWEKVLEIMECLRRFSSNDQRLSSIIGRLLLVPF
jgi:hypothetical protein